MVLAQISYEVSVKMSVGLQPSEYMTGARGSTSNRLIHTAVALSHRVILSSQHTSRSPPEQVTGERPSVFYDIGMEVAWYHVCTVVGYICQTGYSACGGTT